MILSLLMSLCFICGVSAKQSLVTFRGLERGFEFDPGSIYSRTTLFDGFEHAMPGDVLTEHILVQNGAPGYTYIDVYMKAVPHDEEENPLSYRVGENETVASMEDFLSQLYMRVWKGDELIYSASPDETDGLTDFVYLGRIYYKRPVELNVELEVPIELGNEYAHRMGEVDWVFHAEVFGNGGSDGGEPDISDSVSITVHKLWDDDGIIRPGFVNVTLMRDGEAYRTAKLYHLNNWTYTWSDLEKGHDYEVVEDVPAGYTAKYDVYSSWTFITNSKFNPVVPPVTPPNPDIPDDTDEPIVPEDTTVPDEPEDTTVPADPDDTTVPDEPDDTTVPADPDDTTQPDDTDGPDEPDVPVVPVIFGRLTVKKEWSGDKDSLEMRPDSVMVSLFNGTELVEEVWLGAHNDWSYTWKGLDADGQWSVMELDIPEGYTPSYTVAEDGLIVVTNTLTLMETGQTRWHIPVLIIIGASLIAFGAVIIFKKRKTEDE